MHQTYAIVVCYGCGRFLLAKAAQKTKCCPYCATRLKLVNAQKVAHVNTAQEASNYIRALKGGKGFE